MSAGFKFEELIPKSDKENLEKIKEKLEKIKEKKQESKNQEKPKIPEREEKKRERKEKPIEKRKEKFVQKEKRKVEIREAKKEKFDYLKSAEIKYWKESLDYALKAGESPEIIERIQQGLQRAIERETEKRKLKKEKVEKLEPQLEIKRKEMKKEEIEKEKIAEELGKKLEEIMKEMEEKEVENGEKMEAIKEEMRTIIEEIIKRRGEKLEEEIEKEREKKEKELGEKLEEIMKEMEEKEVENGEKMEAIKEEIREKTLEDLEKEIEEKRKIFLEKEKDYKKGKIKEEEITQAKKEYETARVEYWKLKREKIEALKEKDPEKYKEEIEKFKKEIFKDFLKENELIFKERRETLKKIDMPGVFILQKLLEKYAKLPLWKRVLISTGIVTGAAVAGGGIGLGAALIFGGIRFSRGVILGKIAGATAGFVTVRKLEKTQKWLEKEIKELEKDFEIKVEKLTTQEEWRKFLEERDKIYLEVLKEKNKKYKKAIAYGIGAGLLVGIGGGVTIGTLGGPFQDYLTQKLNLSEKPISSPKTLPSFEKEPEKPVSFTKASPLFEKESLPEHIIEVKKGDSLWSILRKQLESHYGEKFKNLGEAQKTYIIDSLKDKITQNPKAFGLEDIDKIKENQKIDLTQIFKDKEFLEKTFEKSSKLTLEQIKTIEHNNEILRNWLKSHPGESLTSEKVEEILRGAKAKKFYFMEPEKIQTPEAVEIFPEKPPEEIQESGMIEISPEKLPPEFEKIISPESVKESEVLAEKLAKSNEEAIVRAIGFNFHEYEVIKNVKIKDLLEQIPEDPEKANELWLQKKIKLPHHGLYGALEFEKHCKLANYIRSFNPGEYIKEMTVSQFLKMVGPKGELIFNEKVY